MWQPTLTGGQLIVRPIAADDFEALYQAASDPLIWAQHSEKSRYERAVFQKFFQGALECGGGLVVIDRASGHVIGSSRYYDWDPTQRSVVIGYTFLARSYWGGTTNRELKNLMLAHAFQWAETAWFHVSPENKRSQRALQKIGATFDRQEDVMVGGTLSPRLLFKIARSATI